MSLMEWRGGFPVVLGGTVATTGAITPDRGGTAPAGAPIRLGAHQVQDQEDGRRGPIVSKWLEIRNLDLTNAIRVFFKQDHFDETVNFITLAAGSTELSKWSGPAEAKQVWLRSTAGTPRFELIAYARRG